jgi:hypothetical protein
LFEPQKKLFSYIKISSVHLTSEIKNNQPGKLIILWTAGNQIVKIRTENSENSQPSGRTNKKRKWKNNNLSENL